MLFMLILSTNVALNYATNSTIVPTGLPTIDRTDQWDIEGDVASSSKSSETAGDIADWIAALVKFVFEKVAHLTKYPNIIFTVVNKQKQAVLLRQTHYPWDWGSMQNWALATKDTKPHLIASNPRIESSNGGSGSCTPNGFGQGPSCTIHFQLLGDNPADNSDFYFWMSKAFTVASNPNAYWCINLETPTATPGAYCWDTCPKWETCPRGAQEQIVRYMTLELENKSGKQEIDLAVWMADELTNFPKVYMVVCEPGTGQNCKSSMMKGNLKGNLTSSAWPLTVYLSICLSVYLSMQT